MITYILDRHETTNLRVRTTRKGDKKAHPEGLDRRLILRSALEVLHGVAVVVSHKLAVRELRQSDLLPENLHAVLEVHGTLLLEEAKLRHRLHDGGATLALAVLVVLLEDLVDGGAVQRTVVVETLHHAVELLQAETDLAKRLTVLGELAVLTAQLAEVLHLLAVVVVLVDALLQRLHVHGVDHLDVRVELLEKGLLLRRKTLRDDVGGDRTSGSTHW